MNIFQNFDYLWHDDNLFDYFFQNMRNFNNFFSCWENWDNFFFKSIDSFYLSLNLISNISLRYKDFFFYYSISINNNFFNFHSFFLDSYNLFLDGWNFKYLFMDYWNFNWSINKRFNDLIVFHKNWIVNF